MTHFGSTGPATTQRATIGVAVIFMVPGYLSSLLAGEGVAQASCLLQDGIYVCSGTHIDPRNLTLSSRSEQPDLNVVADASYLRRNSNAVPPNGYGLMLNVLSGHGGLQVIQEPEALISGGNHGLYGLHAGMGDADVSLAGTVASTSGWAVEMFGGARSGAMRISQPRGVIEGGAGGLAASFSGRGDLDVNAAGRISATSASAVLLSSRASTAALNFRQAETGIASSSGIADVARITHGGRDTLLLQLGGAIRATGASARGVTAVNSSNGSALVLRQGTEGSIASGSHAVVLENRGNGVTEVNLEGRVSSATGTGLYVRNDALAAGLSVRAAGHVAGALSGITVLNDAGRSTSAAGWTRIQVEGDVVGGTQAGVVVNHSTAGDLTLQHVQGAITSGNDGIHLLNTGAGATDVTLHGRVEGGGHGIILTQEGHGDATLNQQAGTVAAQQIALHVNHRGNGNTSVSTAGELKGGRIGVALTSAGDAGMADVTFRQVGGSILGGEAGLMASNAGRNGMTRMLLDGAVVGGSDAAIVTTMNTRLEIGPDATVDGAASGIAIRRQELVNPLDGRPMRAPLHVVNAGTVTGDANLGQGDDTITLVGGHFTGRIHGERGIGAIPDVDQTVGGNDTFVWSGGAFTGSFDGQGGSDTARVSAAGYDGLQRLDGGDDTSVVDGMIDTLTLAAVRASSPGSHLRKWEVVSLDNATLHIIDGAWNVGMPAESTTGIRLENGATLDGGSTLALGANLAIDATSRFIGHGGGEGSFHLSGSLANAGLISTRDGVAGDRLIVAGDYMGTNARLEMDAILGGDNSVSDQLHVDGNVSGTTRVGISNTGGMGARTERGIRLITVGGHSADGMFVLEGRAVAGAHEYFLGKGSGADSNWYLRSALPDDPGGSTSAASAPVGAPAASALLLRPEAGAYLANLTAAQEMFRLGYHHRHSGPNAGRTWVRMDTSYQRFDAGRGQLGVLAGIHALTVGAEVWRGQLGGSAGVALSTGRATSMTTSGATGYPARGKARGKAVAIHGSWRNTGQGEPYDGLYVDGAVQNAWFHNRVDSIGLGPERYQSRVWSSALEAGYGLRLVTGGKSEVHMEPQLQAGYSYARGIDHTETNGTMVTDGSSRRLFGRVSLRLSSVVRRRDGAAEVQPYVTASWLRNPQGAILMDDEIVNVRDGRTQTELNAGATVKFASGVGIWGKLSLRRANGWSESSAQLGLSYRW